MNNTFVIGKPYTRRQIHDLLGGGLEEYLPTKNGRVVCGCFRRDGNPDAPLIVLPGFGEKIQRTARMFASQKSAVPIFLKGAPNEWRYVGDFRVSRVSDDASDITNHEKRANRKGTISMVLFLERVPSGES